MRTKKFKSHLIRWFFTLVLVLIQLSFLSANAQRFPLFDRGPNPRSAMERELIQILDNIPDLPGISEFLQILTPDYKHGQKFRAEFGAIPLRGLLAPNSIQVLVIGQDGTHIAEGANRPGIAGFGGRVHDMLMHFGVFEGVDFTNLYVNTVSGQYGSRNTPMIQTDSRGRNPKLVYRNFIESRQWLATHDGPYSEWRNRLLSWIIRNNSESLKMVVTLGNAGRDAGANFIQSIGGKISPETPEEVSKNLQVPLIKMVSAGGNNEWAVPIDKDGNDIAEVLLSEKEGRPVRLDYGRASDQKKAEAVLSQNLNEARKMMIFPKSGPDRNGALTDLQFGGWDLETMKVGRRKTRSIKGLRIPDEKGGFVEAPDVVFVHAPHPTYLSTVAQSKGVEAAAKLVESNLLEPLREAMKKGWEPPTPEPGLESPFLAGEPYHYGRAVIPESHGDPGITPLRLLPVSTAMRKGSNVIVIGTRDSKVHFPEESLREMSKATPNDELPEAGKLLTGRPLFREWRYQYDRGPTSKFARLLYQSLDLDQIFKPKRGKSWKKDGIDAFNVKTHPDAGAFGHYRGTFRDPRVLILADPHGVDSFITSKAATGARGQYLHGLMEDIGVGSDYLVLNTVPFGMDGANRDEWNTVLKQTESYRENLIKEILKNGTPELIVADGPHAQREIERILEKLEIKNIPVVDIRRGRSASYGIKAAGEKIARLPEFRGNKIKAEMRDIPRKHLTWIARTWEGTSGDRVITSDDKDRGLAFAIVAPDWATDRDQLRPSRTQEVESAKLLEKLEEAGEPLPGETPREFLERRSRFTTRWEADYRREVSKKVKSSRSERRAASQCLGVFL